MDTRAPWNLFCLACGLDLKNRAKDRRILVSANDVVPLWKEILLEKVSELGLCAEISPAQLEILLGKPRDSQHGLICRKCFNTYTRCNKDLLCLGEKMKTAIGNGLFSQLFMNSSSRPGSEPDESSMIHIGEKRSAMHMLPPAKRFCQSTSSRVIQQSPPAVVRYAYNNFDSYATYHTNVL